MAATHISRNQDHRTASAGPPRGLEAGACAIDLVHLSRQTLGDRGLEIELLRLFERQCEQILAKLREAGRAEERRLCQDLAHTLKGSAQAVGARAVAAAAEGYEVAIARGDAQGSAQGALSDLSAATDEARRQVARLLSEG